VSFTVINEEEDVQNLPQRNSLDSKTVATAQLRNMIALQGWTLGRTLSRTLDAGQLLPTIVQSFTRALRVENFQVHVTHLVKTLPVD
jgi:hypothetical protein